MRPDGVELRADDLDAVREVLAGGWLTMGPRTEALEAEVAQRAGLPFAAAVDGGTGALRLALLSSGVSRGDEVLVDALAPAATLTAVQACGAAPVACRPLDAPAVGIDPADAAGRAGPRTRALCSTHRFGIAADTRGVADAIGARERGIAVVDDATRAFGAPVGGDGATAVAFGFPASGPVPAGRAGAVACSGEALDRRVRALRSHGMTSGTWERHRGHALGYDVVECGFNLRIDEPRAALALSLLGALEDELAARRLAVATVRAELAGRDDVRAWCTDAAEATGAHDALVLLARDPAARDALLRRLAATGVAASPLDAPLVPHVAARCCVLSLTAGARERLLGGALMEALG